MSPSIRFVLTIVIVLGLGGILVIAHPAWFTSTVALNATPTPPPSLIALPAQPTPVAHSTSVARPTPRPTVHPTSTSVPSQPHVGSVQHLDNIWITLLSTTVLPRILSFQPNIGDELDTVALTIINRSNTSFTVTPTHYHILDGFGQEDPALAFDPTHTHLREVTLIPGGHTSGTLVFEVPTHDTHSQLIYQPDFLDLSKQKAWWLHWCGRKPC